MTIRLGIIGWPLIKTFSPNIHQTLSEISNVDITYKKLPIENFTLDIFESLNNNFDGYNITIPHKENIYNLSKDLKNVSRSLAVDNIKAVNTVKVDDNIVSLSNTDVEGINQTFEFINFDVIDKLVKSGCKVNIKNKKACLVSFLKGNDKKTLTPKDCYVLGKNIAILHKATKKLKLYRKNSLDVKSCLSLIHI